VFVVVLLFNREDESLSDKAGLILMARAGYNPAEAISFCDELESRCAGDQLPEFFSLHPKNETRIRQLEDFLPYVLHNLSQK
jgi:predicted Zn-dependent protease